MTPETFIARWQDNKLSERAGAQAHFCDLCDLLDVEKPRDPENYCFERGTEKSSGGNGWADVWKRGFFGWENKKPKSDLKAALKQLTDYALHLDNPPLLVVCDRERIEIHTAFTGYPDEPRTLLIEELADESKRQLLRWVFTDPEKLRPEKSTAAITEEVAGHFAGLAEIMRARRLDAKQVAHFLVQCLFCMFAEDENLLPDKLFTVLLEKYGKEPRKATDNIARLFAAMQTGETFGLNEIPWFNGGLFKTIDIPALEVSDLDKLHAAAQMDWRAIDPTIFGTLFERGLDPQSRAKHGAHYTDTGTIEKLIHPLISQPLAREWEQIRRRIAEWSPKFGTVKTRGKNQYRPNEALQRGQALFFGFMRRLETYRVLDPACGSGNFLYLALKALRDMEKRAHVDAQGMGLESQVAMHTGTHNILGLEINEFAAELARVTVWIGDIQWCRRNNYPHAIHPILKPLDGIEHRDALIQGTEGRAGSKKPPQSTNGALGERALPIEATWPEADVIVGNPPFLGGSKKRGELGADYFDALNAVYADAVPGGADLVCYWFHKARQQILAGKLQAAGLVATNSIRGGANRAVLDAIVADTRIFEAWSDEPWINEGAAVRVSLVGFGRARSPNAPDVTSGGFFDFALPESCRLDGREVAAIYADLTAGGGVDLTRAKPLKENANCSFQGPEKNGPFDIDGELARQWLKQPNPNGKPNSEVLKPSWNGLDLTRRPRDKWIIDFGTTMTEADAALFEIPFSWVLEHVKPERDKNRDNSRKNHWWRFGRTGGDIRAALSGLPRYIATAHVSKHRLFIWLNGNVLPDKMLIVIARSDDATFGILHSRFHELWSLQMCTWMGVGNDPRYTPTTCFETFPFPEGMTPRDIVGAVREPPLPKGRARSPNAPNVTSGGFFDPALPIAAAARHLNTLRENWLNPPEWVDWVITPEEEKAGFPKRPVAKQGFAADLKKRTLTNLYNTHPVWLDMAHKALDQAVAAAYGWTDYTPEMPDEEILRRLLTLNLERSP